MLYKRNKLAVIGNPVAHSLSPKMHNAALKYLGLDMCYSAVKVEKKDISSFISEAKEGYLGFNITVPHKKNIIPYLDEISNAAELGNSVNTVKFDEKGKAIGYSTDGYGLEMALKEHFGATPDNENFLFIGCGGAAQATSAHLLYTGAKSITFINRNIEKAEVFIEKLKKYFTSKEINVFGYSDAKKINSVLDLNPLIIQSTSIGLNKSDPLIFNETFFRKSLRCYDMIYKETPFIKCALKHGCMVGNGKLMLLYQGVKSLSIWTGRNDIPVKIMRDALDAAINCV